VSALSATLRIARRDAGRAKVRSGLVVAMIALPLVGVGAADVIWRTFQLSPEQKAQRLMGTADALLEDTGLGSITQYGGGLGYEAGTFRKGPAASPSAVLPAGTRVQPLVSANGRLSTPDLTVETELKALDFTTPLANGLFTARPGSEALAKDSVLLTPALADRLAVTKGDVISLGATRLRVAGLIDSTSSRKVQTAVLSAMPPGTKDVRLSALVDAPRQLTWADVKPLNAVGFQLTPRAELPGTPPAPQQLNPLLTASTLTAASLVVGMVLLEIVLLAGPAFAVGAKRQSRDLALLSASGAERRDIRRTVLSSGLVLGAVGGVVGVLGGVVLAKLAIPLLSSRTGDVPGPFDVRAIEIAVLVVVGVVTAVLAAVIPARNAAHQDVVGALTGRRGQLKSLRRTPVLGAIAAVAGAALALHGARQRDVNTILAGSMLAELGLVATTPFLVGQVGRLSPHLPLGPRLALRDAARNRGRTAPAVSAVLAAVAGSVAIGTYVASLDQYDREAYQPQAVHGSVVAPFYTPELKRKAGSVEAAVRQAMPGAQVHVVRGLADTDGGKVLNVSAPVALRCPVQEGMVPTRAQLLEAERNPACQQQVTGSLLPTPWVVGGPEVLKVLTGAHSPELADVLRNGGAVLPRHNIDADGLAHFSVRSLSGTPEELEQLKELPLLRTFAVKAVALPDSAHQVPVLSPKAAALSGMPASDVGVVALGTEAPSTRTHDRVRTALARMGLDFVHVERGYQSDYGVGLLALVVGSAVIVLGASGIATGLAAADGKADLATLAAIGASPSTRRSLAAFQSAFTAGLGTLLGVAAGLVPAIGMVRALNSAALEADFPRLDPYPLVLPWTNLAVTALVVPLLAAGAAALLTRSRLPMVRRIG
jgi:putative ABC transport system permease protein